MVQVCWFPDALLLLFRFLLPKLPDEAWCCGLGAPPAVLAVSANV